MCVSAGVPTHVWVCVLHLCLCHCVWACVFICKHSCLGSVHTCPCVRLSGLHPCPGPCLPVPAVSVAAFVSAAVGPPLLLCLLPVSPSVPPDTQKCSIPGGRPGTAAGYGGVKCDSWGGWAGPVGEQRFPAGQTLPTGAPRPQP